MAFNYKQQFAFFSLTIIWVKLSLPNGICFLGLFFQLTVFFLFEVKSRRGKCYILPRASYSPALRLIDSRQKPYTYDILSALRGQSTNLEGS